MAILTHPSALDASVEQLAEVGPKTARLLEKLGIRTVRDLLVTLPFGWESFVESPISELVPGAQASVVGTILSIKPLTTQRRRMRLVEATVTDDSGAQMRVVWFHSEFVLRQLHAGDRVAFAGVVEKNRYRGQPGMVNPRYERLDKRGEEGPKKVGGLTPKYHLVAGLTSSRIAELVEQALPLADRLEDLLPADVRERHDLLDISEAVRRGHKPETQTDYLAARKRMTFAELFELQAAFALMRHDIAAEPALPIPYRQQVIDQFKAGLGFELTHAQRRARPCR